jgi:hypothetical protein
MLDNTKISFKQVQALSAKLIELADLPQVSVQKATQATIANHIGQPGIACYCTAEHYGTPTILYSNAALEPEVIIHEVAHHMANEHFAASGHGWEWQAAYAELKSIWIFHITGGQR